LFSFYFLYERECAQGGKMNYLLGIDIGTSGTKSVLFKEKGEIVASAYFEYPLYSEKSGWAEQDPNDWWVATKNAIKDTIKKAGIDSKEIKGIGLSGQMHGLVLLNEFGQVLRKSIIWCDQRTVDECLEIEEKVGKQRLIDITANPALTGFTLSKILWVKNHEPYLYQEVRHILLPKDYIRYKLTGVYATDVSDASGTQLLNVKQRNWSKEILDIFDIKINYLCKVYESSDVTGFINEEASFETNLAIGTIVAGGAGDQAAAAIGNGIVQEGVISCNIGTSGVVFAHTNRPQVDPLGRVHTFCHASKNSWHVMGVTQGAGLSMKWFKDNFYLGKDENNYQFINNEIASVPIGSGGIYLPYLLGERTPHLDPYARGVFFGIDYTTNRAKMVRAVMEGVTFSLYDCLNIISDMGIDSKQIRVCGGGSNSEIWCQMLADVFDREVVKTNSTESGALGVAILAGVASKLFNNVLEGTKCMVQVNEVITPIKEHHKEYLKLYHIYQEIYQNLKGTFKNYQINK
jgi:xylulokinase